MFTSDRKTIQILVNDTIVLKLSFIFQILVAALKFFLGRDIEEGDNSDSEDEEKVQGIPEFRSGSPCHGVYHTFIARFGGRHDDLLNPENSCSLRAKPKGDMNFMG